jgi:hypothetical protein
MDIDQKSSSNAPATIEAYEFDEDFVDCEITCANEVKIRTHRLLLRVIPWFKNAFRLQKTMFVKIPLPNMPSHLVQKIINFCAPNVAFSSNSSSSWLPSKEDIPDFVAMLDYFMMRRHVLEYAVFVRFRCKMLEPIARMVDEGLLIHPDSSDASEAVAPRKTDSVPIGAKVLSPQSIQYLFSHISFDGWPDDFPGAKALRAIAAAGVSMKQIVDIYRCVNLYLDDDFCAIYSGRRKEDLSDLTVALPCVGHTEYDLHALVNRLINIGVRPFIVLSPDASVNHPHKYQKIANFGWRLGWPLTPFAINRNHRFFSLLEAIVTNKSLKDGEVKQIRELMCIIDNVEAPQYSCVPKTYEIAALLGYQLAEGKSKYLRDPCVKKDNAARTIHDLVETSDPPVRKTVLMRHLEKHGFLDNHEVAAEFYDEA